MKGNIRTSVKIGVSDAKDFLALVDPNPLVFFLALAGLFWGFWLVMPWSEFANTTSFALLSELGIS